MEPGNLREVSRKVTVSYPVPFILAASLAFSLAVLAVAAKADDGLSWFLAIFGVFFATNSAALCWYAALRKPELLRSERYSLINRWMELYANNETDPKLRAQMGRALPGLLAAETSKELGELDTMGRFGEDEHGK